MLRCFWQHVGLIFSIILHMGGYTKKLQNQLFFNGFWEGQGVQDGGKLRLFEGMLATS